MAEPQRAYYAIIPANVRYDPVLPANAKLLYGEITALCNERGYCWASNQYFAELYNTAIRTIQRWVSQLAERGYVQIEMQFNPGTREVDFRCIKVATPPVTKMSPPHDKNVVGVTTEMSPPHDKNVVDNNTTSNSTSNISSSRARARGEEKAYGTYGWVKLTDEEYGRLLKEFGPAELERCITYVDESAQGTKNKNGWKDWNVIVRKCHRDGWGRPQQRGRAQQIAAPVQRQDDLERVTRMMQQLQTHPPNAG